MSNFNAVASFYDRLAEMVFGGAIKRAQTAYLETISPGANVLILGGGTGWILMELFAINPTCKVWYIDASSRMIDLAKRTVQDSKHHVIFIHGTEDSIPPAGSIDVVITNFYLDLFPPASCDKVIQKISTAMHAKSIWLIADFDDTTWWHGVILRVMYIFFRMTTGIEASSLCNWRKLMERNGFQVKESTEFFRGFIKSAVFRSIF
jgi:ubiquinone/menaquinone biosynthesis C-methylase UbiE